VEDVIMSDTTRSENVPGDAQRQWRRAGGWMISGGLHALLLCLFALLITTQPIPSIDPPPVTATAFLPPAKPEKPTTPVVHPKPTDPQPPDLNPVPDDPVGKSDDQATQSTIDPDPPSNNSATPMVTDSTQPSERTDSLGFTTGSLGIGPEDGARPPEFGQRGQGKGLGHGPRSSRQEVAATNAALRWFTRHQSPDGHWDVDHYQAQCRDDGPKCEPGTANTGAAGDIACTSLALLCYLGYGHDGTHSTMYRSVVAKGLTWLAAQQGSDGVFGARNYEHAVAVMALADAMGMAAGRLESLRPGVTKGVKVILARQNPGVDKDTPSGWDYIKPNPKRDDSSVTGWNIMALKSAHMAGIDIGRGMTGARSWLNRAWTAANPDAAKLTSSSESGFPYTFDQTTGATERDHLAGLAATCAAFLGHQRGDVMIESLANRIVAKDLPKLRRWPCNTYQLYYATMAMFQVTCDPQGRDARWNAWYQPISSMLVGSQRHDEGCFDGSWDFAGTVFPGHETGRLLSTALCCLSLEVQERFAIQTKAH
jgi:hypothetical protein